MASGMASLEQHQFVKRVLFFYVLPLIAALGMSGNMLSVAVLRVSQRAASRGHAFTVYLLALTTADVLLLLLALGRCIVLIAARFPNVRYPALNTYGEYYLSIVLGGLLQRTSATLISIIAIERFIAVAFPFQLKLLSIEKYPVKIIVGVIVVNIICQIPTVVLLDVVKMTNPLTNATDYGFALRFPSPTSVIVRQVYLVFLAVIGQFIPLLIVITSTAAILLCLKMRSTSLRLSRDSNAEAKERDTMTLTLASMAIIFTLCYIPAIVVYAISASNTPSYIRREAYLIAIIVDINVVTVCLNSASDFLMYFLNSRKFRDLFVEKILSCGKLRDASPVSHANVLVSSTVRRGSLIGQTRSAETSISSINVSIVEIP